MGKTTDEELRKLVQRCMADFQYRLLRDFPPAVESLAWEWLLREVEIAHQAAKEQEHGD